MENTWGGFTQKGANIVITPKNSSCSICYVSDVTLRYNYVLHGSQGLQVSNGQSGSKWSLGGYNYSFHDLVFDGMQYSECYECGNFLNEFTSGYSSSEPPPAAEVMHDVTINHITMVNAGFLASANRATGFMEMSGPPKGTKTATPRIDNFELTNSIGDAGTNGAYPTGGGSDNCAVSQKTVSDEISACWAGTSSLTSNVFVTDYTTTTLTFPSGNFTASAWSKVGFVNFNNGDSGDYHLTTSSKYHNGGSDGKDLGADIDAVDSAKSFAE
jgi:hypothetical protein